MPLGHAPVYLACDFTMLRGSVATSHDADKISRSVAVHTDPNETSSPTPKAIR
jgi:hypothetical protein